MALPERSPLLALPGETSPQDVERPPPGRERGDTPPPRPYGQTRRFRRLTFRTLSLEVAWREVEQIALGRAGSQNKEVTIAPHAGDEVTIAATEQGSSARRSMLWRWQRRAMSLLSTPGTARRIARRGATTCQTPIATGDRRVLATARCRFSPIPSGSATEMTEAYRAVCPEEHNHVDG